MSDLASALIQRLYLNEIQHAKRRRKLFAREIKEMREMIGNENRPHRILAICEPRATGARNKHVFRELLFDGTPEEHDEFVSEWVDQQREGETQSAFPEIPEMKNLIDAIMGFQGLKVIDEAKVRVAIENFVVDVLSTVKAQSQQLPKYAKRMSDRLFDKLFSDLFSSNLSIAILVPIFRLDLDGSNLSLQKSAVIRRLTYFERFEQRYLFPAKKSIPHGALANVIEIRKSTPRDNFNASSAVSESELALVQNTVTLLSLFEASTVCSTAALVINPYYENEPLAAVPLETNLEETDLALSIDRDTRKKLEKYMRGAMGAANVVRTDQRISVCFDFYRKSLSNLPFEYRLLSAVIAWEVLMGSFGRDTAQWVGLRAGRLLGSLTSEKPDSVLGDIRRAFGGRNEFLHEGIISPNSVGTIQTAMPRLQRYLRKSIVILSVLMTKIPYRTIMDNIDTSVRSTSLLPSDSKSRKLRQMLLDSGF